MKIIQYLKSTLRSSTIKNTSVLLTGNLIASALAVVFALLAARGLEPAGWGVVAAVISVITIGEAIGDLGLSSSLYRFFSKSASEGKHSEAEEFKQQALFLRILSSCLILLFFAFFSSSFSQIVYKTNEPILSILSGLGIFAYLLLEFQVAAMQARGKWKLSAYFITGVNLLRLIIVWYLYLKGNLTVYSTLWAYSGTALATLLISAFWEPFKISWKNPRKMLQILNFSGWLGLNRIAGSIAARIDVILLLNLTGAYSAGLFGAAKQLALGVPILIGSLATVLAPSFATVSKENAFTYFKKTIWLSVILCLGLGLGILISPFVIELFGPKYKDSLDILRWLLVGYIPFVLATPAVNLLIYNFHKPKIIGILSMLLVPIVWFLNVYLIPLYGVWGAVAVHVAWNLITMLVAYSFVIYYSVKNKK